MDVFNVVAMEVFHLSLNNFPQATEIDTMAVSKVVIGYFEIPDNKKELDNLISDIDDIVFETVIWLKDEGFLKDKGSSDNGFVVVLTNHGLTAINEVPIFLDSKKTFKKYFYQGITGLPFSTLSGLMVDFFKNGS